MELIVTSYGYNKDITTKNSMSSPELQHKESLKTWALVSLKKQTSKAKRADTKTTIDGTPIDSQQSIY